MHEMDQHLLNVITKLDNHTNHENTQYISHCYNWIFGALYGVSVTTFYPYCNYSATSDPLPPPTSYI